MDSSEIRIVIFNTDPDLTGLLGSVLKDEGFKVHREFNKDVAYHWICENKPHLVISGLHSPVKREHELIDLIHKNPKTKNIPILFLCTEDKCETKTIASDDGAVSYLMIPADFPDLLATIRKILVQHSPSLSLRSPKPPVLSWSSQKNNFVKYIEMTGQRSAILSHSDFPTGDVNFITEYGSLLIGCKLCKPIAENGLQYSDVLYFRYYLDIWNLRRGLLLAESHIDRLVNKYAETLGIIALDQKRIKCLLSEIDTHQYNKRNYGLFVALQLDPDEWDWSDDFRIFMARIKLELKKLEDRNISPVIAINKINQFEITLLDKSSSREIIIGSNVIQHIIAALWIDGFLSIKQIKVDRVGQKGIAAIFSNIPGISIENDLIILNER